LLYDWTTPTLICSALNEFKATELNENFTKGCHWSPDGTCILVPAEDFKIHIFELAQELYAGNFPKDFSIPSFESTLKVKEGGLIYDSCWFPYMSSWDPSTCCFLSTSQGSPIHLWDAFTGQLRATYRAYNQLVYKHLFFKT
jgi:WD40 repeat protein